MKEMSKTAKKQLCRKILRLHPGLLLNSRGAAVWVHIPRRGAIEVRSIEEFVAKYEKIQPKEKRYKIEKKDVGFWIVDTESGEVVCESHCKENINHILKLLEESPIS